MVSKFRPSVQKARPWMACECATQFISGRAVCTAWWIMYATQLQLVSGEIRDEG
jgi:hypothetical protein